MVASVNARETGLGGTLIFDISLDSGEYVGQIAFHLGYAVYCFRFLNMKWQPVATRGLSMSDMIGAFENLYWSMKQL